MNRFWKIAGVVAACVALIAVISLVCCSGGKEAPRNVNNNVTKLPVSDYVIGTVKSWEFEDADGTKWEAATDVSADGKTITVFLPMDGVEAWSYDVVSKGDAALAKVEEPAVTKDKAAWYVTFSAAAAGDADIVFSQRYPAGSQPEKRQCVIGVNVANDHKISVLGAKGHGFPAEWYDQEPAAALAVRLPVAKTGKWEFTADDKILEVLAGPSEEGGTYSVSYRALQPGETTLTVIKLDDKGSPEYSGILSLTIDDKKIISVKSATWNV